MKIYLKTGKQDHMMFVTPAVHSDSSDFLMEDGTKRQFTVRFKNGMAEVPSNLGAYMVDHGLAQESQIILPENMIAAQAIEQRTVRMRNLGA